MALVASPASAQVPTQLQRFERQLEQIRLDTQLRISDDIPVDQRTFFDAGAYATFFLLALDDRSGKTHLLRQTDVNVYARANIDGAHQFFIRGRSGWQDFNSGDSFDGNGDSRVGFNLDRAFYRFDLGRASEAYEGQSLDYNLVVQVGRQFTHWANGLVLTEALDGGSISFESGDLTFDVIAGKTYEEQADFDASRPDFSDDLDRDFFGGMISYQVQPEHKLFAYGLVQYDQNNKDTTTARYGYDSYYIGFGSSGNFGQNILYGVEAAVEGGQGLSTDLNSTLGSVGQTKEDIQAWALDARASYLLNDPANTRFTGELVLASGDDDRAFSTTTTTGGNQSGTDDNAFNAFGLIDTGLVFAPNVSNLFLIRLGASTYPLHDSPTFKRLQIGADFFIFNKLDSDAPSTEISDNDSFLGTELDLFANWQITSDFSWSVRYGVFFPGEGISGSSLLGVSPADSDARHFLYTGVTLAF